MHDNDSFRLISGDSAVLVGCFLAAAVVLIFAPEERKPAPAPKARTQCDVTVAQYGPGERYTPAPREPACAGTTHALPNHIMTYPIAEAK